MTKGKDLKKRKSGSPQERKGWRVVFSILLFVALLVAGYAYQTELLVEKGGKAGGLCSLWGLSSCEYVLTSEYARWFGLPLPVYAAGFYLALLVCIWGPWESSLRWSLAFLGSTTAVFISFVLFVVTRKILHAACSICYSMYALHILMWGTVLWGMQRPWSTFKGNWNRLKIFRAVAYSLALILVVGTWYGRPAKNNAWSPWNPLSQDESSETNTNKSSSAFETFYQQLLQSPRALLEPGLCTPLYGSPSAKVRLWEFSDFQCPWCRRMASTLETLIERFPSDLYIEYCNFPLDPSCNPQVRTGGHPLACRLALIAECAARVGEFRTVHNDIFRYQDVASEWLAGTIPESVAHRYMSCAQEGLTLPRIKNQIQLGLQLHIDSTPTLFINGMRLSGVNPDWLPEIIVREIERFSR